MVWWNLLFRNLHQLFTLKMLSLPRRSDWKTDRTICTNMVTFPNSLVLWAEGWHTQLSWTCYAISGMPLWPQPLVWHTHAARDWCHKTSLCHPLREVLGDCPFGFVFWENDILPGASRADISRQQEPSTGVLWGLWTEACSGGLSCAACSPCMALSGCLQRLAQKQRWNKVQSPQILLGWHVQGYPRHLRG